MARKQNKSEVEQHLSGETETSAITEPTLEGQVEEQASNESTEQADGTSESIGDPAADDEN